MGEYIGTVGCFTSSALYGKSLNEHIGVEAGAACILLNDYTVFRKKQILWGSKPPNNIGEVTITGESQVGPGEPV